ncbi:hypothetical protein [Xanthomonas campestris]|uniref:hypothetical protein n=1 Tax=Xanthomonas campestris TaxID=339 RepID=UPI0023E944E9|nr:hypothetical protein [Xanthomonas campestris]
MLSTHEFTVGKISQASPLTLVLPREPDEATMLVGHFSGEIVAVALTGHYEWKHFEIKDNNAWAGLLVPDIRIEVDPLSAFIPSSSRPTLGTIVRRERELALAAKTENIHNYTKSDLITLEHGLLTTHDEKVGFFRWHVVIGTGTDKRVLHAVTRDTTPSRNA